jgi:hypothetical protein
MVFFSWNRVWRTADACHHIFVQTGSISIDSSQTDGISIQKSQEKRSFWQVLGLKTGIMKKLHSSYIPRSFSCNLKLV